MKQGTVVWFTGLPASGKTTLARRVEQRLARSGWPSIVLDSDELREALGASLGYAANPRAGFYRVLANLACLLARQGHLVLVAATAHRRAFRDRARRLAPRFLEVFVDVPVATCAGRDVKGLYRLAARGKLSALPGVGARYEAPRHAELVAHGGRDRAAVEAVLGLLAASARSAPIGRPPRAKNARVSGSR